MAKSHMKIVRAGAAVLAISLLVAEPADARRGGSFGSRGSRTYMAPQPTGLSPGYTGPVQRSMTAPAPSSYRAPAAQAFGPQRGRFGGFGGGLLGGLLLGGLVGGLMGHGFGGGWGGGGGGFLILLQLAILGGLGWLLLSLFRRRNPLAAAGAGPSPAFPGAGSAFAQSAPFAAAGQPVNGVSGQDLPISVSQSDRDAFAALLAEVQDAFGHEDYGRLRDRTTPEVMSYLAEELSQNATQGRRNEVTGTRLLGSDVAEAWREGDTEYATAALRYESIDVMRDRATGALLNGDAARPTETTELWTFKRQNGGPWLVSAIQETGR